MVRRGRLCVVERIAAKVGVGGEYVLHGAGCGVVALEAALYALQHIGIDTLSGEGEGSEQGAQGEDSFHVGGVYRQQI